MNKVVISLLLITSTVSFSQNFPLISPEAKSVTETKLIDVNNKIISRWDVIRLNRALY